MRKPLKITLITILALFILLGAMLGYLLWFVATPPKLTSALKQQVPKFINCHYEIGEVEITFFRTFPKFGIRANDLILINPVPGAPTDTLAAIDEVVGTVDISAWFKNNELVVDELICKNSAVTIFYDSLGHSNFDVVVYSSEDTVATTFIAGLNNIQFENVDFRYVDNSLKTKVLIDDLYGTLSGSFVSGTLISDISIDNSIITVGYSGENYLDRVATSLKLVSEISVSPMSVNIKEASGSIASLPVFAEGLLKEDTVTGDLLFDVDYQIKESQADQILSMVPTSYSSYFDGITLVGNVAVDGTIKGTYSQSTMPIFGVNLQFNDAKAAYRGISLQLHDLNGQLEISTDGMTDSLTYVSIKNLTGKTPLSSFAVTGGVKQLFSDISCDLLTDADLTLDEFNVFIPDSLNFSIKGKAKGQVSTVFTMQQIENMAFEKMKIAGNVLFSTLEATYDSISVTANSAKMKFALPNSKAGSKTTTFLSADIIAKKMNVSLADTLEATLGGAHVIIESSDFRDSTRIPDAICSFTVDSLWGKSDTISVAMNLASGRVRVQARDDAPENARVQLSGRVRHVDAVMGQSKMVVNKVDLNTEILSDKKEKDPILQWMPTGTIGLENGLLSMNGFYYPIEIPAISIGFSPQTVTFKEGRLKIDKSDFQLVGAINNVLPYYRGDSILRGNLKFNSATTDILQLMTMTNGIGYEEEVDSVPKNAGSGPYMVPKGIDVTLDVDVKNASFGVDSAKNIRGSVRVSDGILLLDELKFSIPATRMQVTAMYRTPRKNHLFLGIDLHMLDVQIEELLQMVPDIDSMMPMLRSFRGEGEFHMAAETYLDSMYRFKKSTLRGAASIKGENLVLLDGETFTEIAKTLKFNKKTENRVDSLSAEFTIFRNEIDIYPFLIVMDKYKAVVAGRHNLDMSFDYHISVVDCPLPLKLGVDVKGKIDDLSYKLAPCRYAEFYRPSSRRVVENKQLELRKMIHDELVKRVKEP